MNRPDRRNKFFRLYQRVRQSVRRPKGKHGRRLTARERKLMRTKRIQQDVKIMRKETS
jgi:hypothetical protein